MEPSRSGSGEVSEGPQHAWLHWGAVMALTYAMAVGLLTFPVLYGAFPSENWPKRIPWELMAEPVYLGFVVVVALSQFLLIRVPVRLRLSRPVTRRAIWLPIVVSGFWIGALVLGAIFSVLEWRKIAPENLMPLWIGVPVVSWIAWTAVFRVMSGRMDPASLIRTQSRWMIRGSILELLVALPTHIVARGRPDCCAGFMTFIGLTMGISVMLLAFGPAVFVLYYARWKRVGR